MAKGFEKVGEEMAAIAEKRALDTSVIRRGESKGKVLQRLELGDLGYLNLTDLINLGRLDGELTGFYIANAAIGSAKIGQLAVGTDKLAAGAVTSPKQGSGAAFGNGFEDGEFGDWTTTSGDTITQITDSYSGDHAAEMTSTETSPSSSGTTGGVYVAIPESIALELGGNRVRVEVYAKQPSSGASSEFAVAYSTDDVGNSGWRKFAPTTSYQKFSFYYDVPSPDSGGNDYIGVWADTSGGGDAVIVDRVAVVPYVNDDTIDTPQLVDLAVGSAKIANLAVESAKMDNLAVKTAKIADLAVTDAKIDTLTVDKLTAGTLDIVADIGSSGEVDWDGGRLTRIGVKLGEVATSEEEPSFNQGSKIVPDVSSPWAAYSFYDSSKDSNNSNDNIRRGYANTRLTGDDAEAQQYIRAEQETSGGGLKAAFLMVQTRGQSPARAVLFARNADGTASSFLRVTPTGLEASTLSMEGNIAMNGNIPTGLPAPGADSHATRRKYVDDELAKKSDTGHGHKILDRETPGKYGPNRGAGTVEDGLQAFFAFDYNGWPTSGKLMWLCTNGTGSRDIQILSGTDNTLRVRNGNDDGSWDAWDAFSRIGHGHPEYAAEDHTHPEYATDAKVDDLQQNINENAFDQSAPPSTWIDQGARIVAMTVWNGGSNWPYNDGTVVTYTGQPDRIATNLVTQYFNPNGDRPTYIREGVGGDSWGPWYTINTTQV